MKKKLYLIGGTMGVGKTTVSRILKEKLSQSVFLDGDWCWDSSPFVVTDETRAMVLDNIAHLLNNFLSCSAYDHVIFCWVMHEDTIIKDILGRLNTENCEIFPISLICDPESLEARLRADVEAGIRQPDIIERSVARLRLYSNLNTIKIDTSGKTPSAISDYIIALTF